MLCMVSDLCPVPLSARDADGRDPGQVVPAIGPAADSAWIASPSPPEGVIYQGQVSQRKLRAMGNKLFTPLGQYTTCNLDSVPASVTIQDAVDGSVLPASGEATTSCCNQSNTTPRPPALKHSLRAARRGAKRKPAGITEPTEDPMYPQRREVSSGMPLEAKTT